MEAWLEVDPTSMRHSVLKTSIVGGFDEEPLCWIWGNAGLLSQKQVLEYFDVENRRPLDESPHQGTRIAEGVDVVTSKGTRLGASQNLDSTVRHIFSYKIVHQRCVRKSRRPNQK
jgi:hypothetical protein